MKAFLCVTAAGFYLWLWCMARSAASADRGMRERGETSTNKVA